MTFELGRSLLLSGAVTPDALARALAATLEPGMPLARALVGLGLIDERELNEALKRSPGPALAEVHPVLELLGVLPTGLCNRLAALPVRVGEDGVVDVAVLDPRDPSVGDELAFHLQRPVRLLRAPYAALREALVNYATNVRSVVPPAGLRRERRRAVSYTPAWGTPIDTGVPEDAGPPRRASPVPAFAPTVAASVTTSTRRFFAGMHSAPSEPPAPPPPQSGASLAISPYEDTGAQEPVFELRRGPNLTLPDIEPPTLRTPEVPAFPLVSSLPKALPSITPGALGEHFPDPASTLGDLRLAATRDAILGLVEKSARAVARRVALLVVRRNALVGWSCSPEFGPPEALRSLSISTRTPSLLSTVLAGGVYVGPLLGSFATALLQVMQSASREVALVAVRVKDKPAVLIVADELSDALLATRHLDILAKVAGESLARLLHSRRSEPSG